MQEIDYANIGMRIRQVRKAKGWSQDELAKKCGISMAFLGHIERGRRVMSLDTFANLCTALHVHADELLWGVVSPIDDNQINIREHRTSENSDADRYSMYTQIMKSVAAIMNGEV